MRRVLCWALAYSAAIYGGNFAAEASKDAAGAHAGMLSKLIQPMGPRYTVDVRPGTAEDVAVAAAKPNSITTMDARGVTYACQLPAEGGKAAGSPQAGPPEVAKGSAPVPSSTSGDNVDTGGTVADEAPEEAVEAAITALQGQCTTKKTGWWTYQVCHFKEVRQYHEEGNKVDDGQNWSLGSIQPPSDLGAFEPGTKDRRARAVHPFSGGKTCEETNEARRGSVHYECRGINAGPSTGIFEIEEPSTCVYAISLHVPALCKVKELQPPAALMPVASDTPGAVAKLYRERCFYRNEGWWTYEFCVNKHVRQFRQESGKSPATAESETPEYSLGHVTPARAANLAYVPTLHAKDSQRSYASASYTGGSKCDLVDHQRQTEVRMKCAADGVDRFLSIQEVAICKYRLIFASAKMCALSDFAAAEEKVRVITCVYEDEDEAVAIESAEAEEAEAEAGAEAERAAAAAASADARQWAALADPDGQRQATVTAGTTTIPKVTKLKPKRAARPAKAPPTPPPMTKTPKSQKVPKHDVVAKTKLESKLVKAMNASQIKKELTERGLDVSTMVERDELVQALVQARVEGVQAFMPGGGAPGRFVKAVETKRHVQVSGQKVAKLMAALQNTCSQVRSRRARSARARAREREIHTRAQ
jgi:hypothetical protein